MLGFEVTAAALRTCRFSFVASMLIPLAVPSDIGSFGPERDETLFAGVTQAGLLDLKEPYGDAFILANGEADPANAENALVVLAR